MIGKLTWVADDLGIHFNFSDTEGEWLPPEKWSLCQIVNSDGKTVTPAPLLALLEDEIISLVDGEDISVPHPLIAGFDERQVAQLGLPASAPVRLKISGKGILTSPQFRFQYQLLKVDGTPVMGGRRTGSQLQMGALSYLLLDPLYSLIEGMERFNAIPPEDMDSRMLCWAEMKLMLPEDAVVDSSLRSMNIVRVDSFTLDIDDNGDFSPQLLHKPHKSKKEDELESKPAGEAALPGAPQKDFQRRFRAQAKARRYYTAAGGWFIVIPERLTKALEIVREKQDASWGERQAFIANPSSVLKDRLQNEFAEEEIESFFEETPEFLSARVSHLGEWEPKQNVYIMSSGQKWLPDDMETFGVMLGNSLISIAPEDISSVFTELEEAKKRGEASVNYRDQEIPVSDESIDTIGRLSRSIEKSSGDADRAEVEHDRKVAPQVPVLIDNVEELGYAVSSRPVRGEPGGLPSVLKTTSLFPHQAEGVKWLQEHWASGSTGALLADDMGLGKTLQTLTFLAWIQEQMEAGNHPRKPLLIVAPTGLLKNWEDEANIHLASPGLGGLFKAFGDGLNALKDLSHNQRKDKLSTSDWVLTTYETLRDKIRYFLPVDWAVVAFDEVQKIKNPASRLTEMAKSVQADFFLALTGTPIENRLGDLWSIIDTVAPGTLGSLKDFHSRYEGESNEETAIAVADLRRTLTETPKPVRLLRRMKSEHLKGLPDKTEHIIRMPMPSAQANAYDAVIASVRAGVLEKGDILGVLQGMRKVSLLPDAIGDKGITDEVIASSARLTALVSILDEVKSRNEKALVFLEFIAVQDSLIPYLQARYGMARPPLRISGSVQGHVRKKHVDEFQSRPRDEFDVMLLSPKAGGVGLTLTAANNVIHLSRWWNPAVEEQCTDRVFRIGQDKPVNVYYPLAIHPFIQESSFDVNLHGLLERKRELSRQLLSAPDASADELESLLKSSI